MSGVFSLKSNQTMYTVVLLSISLTRTLLKITYIAMTSHTYDDISRERNKTNKIIACDY